MGSFRLFCSPGVKPSFRSYSKAIKQIRNRTAGGPSGTKPLQSKYSGYEEVRISAADIY
jgi:hypothetical protein